MHHLLGSPDQIQGDMKEKCQLASSGLYLGSPEAYKSARAIELKNGATDWRLLLQIDSDWSGDRLNIMWGDDGRIYHWIRRQELEAKSFDKAWLILQCY